MQLGALEFPEPVPTLHNPYVLLTLQPWIDVGAVGTSSLSFLEEQWGAKELGKLTKPGTFYDFTRYRPIVRRREGSRYFIVPNTVIWYAQEAKGHDWVFIHALEPHSHGEEYTESLGKLLRHFGVRQYGMVGSMYAPVPHTRSLPIAGSSSDGFTQERLVQLRARTSTYEGPTSIVSMVTEDARSAGIETFNAIVQLPVYARVEADYQGQHTLLKLLSEVYDLSLNLGALQKQAEEQYQMIDQTVAQDPRVRRWIKTLEAQYDANAASQAAAPPEPPKLSPELERFLKELEEGSGGTQN
jgi:predicted ATP-grasp superfamily ATP-dependent carboligase